MEHGEIRASRLKMGAYCTWIVGGCYFLIVIFAFLSPTSVASYITSKQYFLAFQSYRYDFILLKCLLGIANGAFVGIVIALYSIRDRKGEGVMTLFAILAIVGLGVGMYQSVVDATRVPHLATEYMNSSPETQHVIIAFGVANPALYALSLGLPGIWLIFMGFSYIGKLSPFLVILNVAWGIGNIVTVCAHMFVLIWLIYLVAAGAFVISPFWTIWLSRFLWKESKKSLS